MKHLKEVWAGLLLCLLLGFTPAEAQQTSNLKKLKKVSFQTADTSMNIVFNARMQNLLVVTNQQSEGLAPSQAEFLTRRMRLKASGFLVDPRLTFKLELAFSKRDLSQQLGQWGNNLYDAYIDYDLNDHFSLRFGQFKLPGNRQRVVSSQALQLVDRSPANSTFNLDRDVGLMLAYGTNIGQAKFKYIAALSNGEGRNILSSKYKENRDELNLALTQRVEFLPFGAFTGKGDYFESDLMREKNPKLSVGAGYYHNNDAIRSQGQLGSQLKSPTDINSFFADLIYKHRGLSVMAEYMQMDSPNPVTGTEGDIVTINSGDGYMVQAGYLFPSFWEIAARHSEVQPNESVQPFRQPRSETVLGLNKYIRGHYIKVQTDIGYIQDKGAAADFQDYWRWRFQMELAF